MPSATKTSYREAALLGNKNADDAEAQLLSGFCEKVDECERLQAELKAIKGELNTVRFEMLESKWGRVLAAPESSESNSSSGTDGKPEHACSGADNGELSRAIALGKKHALANWKLRHEIHKIKTENWKLKDDMVKSEAALKVAEARAALLQEALDDARKERERRHATHLYLRDKCGGAKKEWA